MTDVSAVVALLRLTKEVLLARLTYPFRLAWAKVRHYDVPCRASWCVGQRVGFSIWCREHTDRILAGER